MLKIKLHLIFFLPNFIFLRHLQVESIQHHSLLQTSQGTPFVLAQKEKSCFLACQGQLFR